MSTSRRPRDRSLPVLAAIAALIAAMSIWLALTLQPANAATEETVPARGWSHDGFGRLVFDWQSQVGYSARIEGGRLVVEFDRPARFAFDRALANLTSYLADGEVAPDGRSAVFTLARQVTLKTFKDGPKVVVDLTPAAGPAAASTPERAEAPAKAAAAQPVPGAVPVRGGEHEGFSRLVFDWPESVPYEITRQGDVALVSFRRAARLDIGAISRRPLKRIAAVETSTMTDRVIARLTLPAGATLSDFVSGTSVVIDVRQGGAGAAAAVPQSAPAQAAPAQAAPTQAAAPTPAAPASPQPAAAPEAPRFASAPPSEAAAPSPGAPVQLVPPMAATEKAATPQPAAEPASRTTPAKPAAPAAAAPVGELPVLPVTVETDRDGATLRLAWSEKVAAAAFRRAGVVWLVFDRPSRFDLKAVIAAELPELGKVTQLDHPEASILQFSGDQVVTPRLVADGTAWTVDFRPQAEGPLTVLEPKAQMSGPSGGQVLIAVTRPSQPIEIVDPEVGDQLIVAAVAQAGAGIGPGRQWPDMVLLPTQQGIVVAPRGEGVIVQSNPVGIVIKRTGGLLMSREAAGMPARQVAAAPAAPKPANRLFDLVDWRHEESDFITARQELQQAVVEVDEDLQNLARLDLARFYFAHGLATESAGLIELIGRDNGDLRNDPELLLMSGASHLLHDDLPTARTELENRALDGEPEARLWRAALAATMGEWEPATAGFAKTLDLIATYPHVTRARLLLLAAESEIEAGDPGGAAQPLDMLRRDAPTPDEAAQLAYLEGLKSAREGRTEDAASAWRSLTEDNHQPTRARAIFQLTELMLREGKLETAEAIERLERLRFIWRGGPFEFTVLRRLGQLYIADGKPREGLTVLRQAVATSPEHRDAQAVAGEMADAFRDLYLGDGAGNVPPLVAVALFDEFRELTPAGAEGDRLIAGLADRLVEVDLLERADKLLADQIRYRLQGQERAEAGARLAEIRLLDRRPEEALSALQGSDVPDLPDDLAGRRHRLQARALYGTGQAAAALALLETDGSVEGTAQRAEMLWRMREWAGAADALGNLLELAGAPDAEALDPRRADLVLNRAVALTLAGNRRDLELLGQRYGEAIAETAQAEPFKLLTDSVGDDMTTRSIAEQLASASRLEGFLVEYRQQVQTAAAPAEE